MQCWYFYLLFAWPNDIHTNRLCISLAWPQSADEPKFIAMQLQGPRTFVRLHAHNMNWNTV